MTDRRRTVFDHVPKTAGTSVRCALAAALGENVGVPEVSHPHHVALRFSGARRCIASHLWFYPGESLAPDWLYATLLREPVDRVLSQYFFYRSHRSEVRCGSMTDPQVVSAVELDLERYLAHPAARPGYTNLQAIHFAWRVCDAPEELDEVSLLDAAIASLEDYDLVGVFGNVGGFLDAYCDALAVPRQPMPRLNVTAGRVGPADVPRPVLERLHSSNAVDALLYKWAERRFADRRFGRRATNHPHRVPARADFGNRLIEILSSRCEGAVSGSAVVAAGERVLVKMSCRASVDTDLTAGIAVRNRHGALVYATNSRQSATRLTPEEPQTFEVSFALAALLDAGEYHVTLALHKGLSHFEGCYHWLENAASFVVSAARPVAKTEFFAVKPWRAGAANVILNQSTPCPRA